MSKKRIRGARALVTGAGRGIGLATALELARAGAEVVVTDLDGGLAEQAVRRVEAAGGRAIGRGLDVADRAAVDQVVAELERSYPIDVLVNNAGIMLLGGFLEHGAREDERQLDVNLRGVVHMMRAVLPGMVARGRGHVVNVASMAGRVGAPYAAMYSATKFAVVGLTEAVRGELIDSGVEFSYVMPTLVDTELISGAGRPAWPPVLAPAEVAVAIREAIERGEVDVCVPRLSRYGLFLPLLLSRPALDWVGKRLKVHEMFASIDARARAAYVARTGGPPDRR